MNVIYRIYSESDKVVNYIDYDPSKSYWLTPKRHDNRRKLGVKTNHQELFEESKCAISKLKSEKSFTETPKDTKIIEVVIPKGQKRATLVTSECTSAEFDLYLDLKIVPQIRTSDGKVVGYKIVAEDGGIGKARQSGDADTVIRERGLNEEKMREAYALNKAIANTGSEWVEQQHKLLSANPLKKEAELVM